MYLRPTIADLSEDVGHMSSPTERIPINDSSDPRIEDYRDIRDRDLRGSGARPGLFIGEAILVVEVMLSFPGMTRSVLASEQQADRLEAMIARSNSPQTPLYVAGTQLMRQVAGFDIHRGVLACGNRPEESSRSLEEIVPETSREATILVCDRINNIDNIGLLFRNAAAFGVDAVVLSPECHDPLYRKSLRVSIGHALRIPFHRSKNWSHTLDELRSRHQIELIGTSLDPSVVPLEQVPPTRRVGLLVGSEFDGLGPESTAACDQLVRIPMAPGTDSLNVGVAAAVCLHRFSRSQRT